jgi:DNA invertase Pin-like site-specific DNA recombinase
MKQYVAYYLVSTQKQGSSGLGLQAQKETVRQFIGSNILITEYTEIESGKNDKQIELLKAIADANKNNATLIIAKLDRYSRNVGFIFQLRDSKVDFTCCDIPDANTMTIGIFALLAQQERELISERTKKALQAKKENGFTMVSPKTLQML